MQRLGPGAKTTEVEVRVVLLCASTDDGRPLIAGSTNLASINGGTLQVADNACGTHKSQKFSS